MKVCFGEKVLFCLFFQPSPLSPKAVVWCSQLSTVRGRESVSERNYSTVVGLKGENCVFSPLPFAACGRLKLSHTLFLTTSYSSLIYSYYPGTAAAATAATAGAAAAGNAAAAAAANPALFYHPSAANAAAVLNPMAGALPAYAGHHPQPAVTLATTQQQLALPTYSHQLLSQQIALQQQLQQQQFATTANLQQHSQQRQQQLLFAAQTTSSEKMAAAVASNNKLNSSSSSSSPISSSSHPCLLSSSGSSPSSSSIMTSSSSSTSPSAKKFRPAYTRPSGKSQRYIPKPIPQELGNLKVYSKKKHLFYYHDIFAYDGYNLAAGGSSYPSLHDHYMPHNNFGYDVWGFFFCRGWEKRWSHRSRVSQQLLPKTLSSFDR